MLTERPLGLLVPRAAAIVGEAKGVGGKMTTKELPRTTVCTLFEIRFPIWNGGKRAVGLNLKRITKHNEIRILYRRKSDNELTYPDPFYLDSDQLKGLDYEVQNTKGVTLVLVPIDHLERLVRV